MKTLLLIATLFLVPLVSHSQTRPLSYDPPEGWKFRRHFDSVSIISVSGAGDTIFVLASGLETQKLFSSDGGVTWNSYNSGANLLGTWRLFKFEVLDGDLHFGTSSDFGATFTYHKSNIAWLPDDTRLIVDPLNPSHLLLHMRVLQGPINTSIERFARSTDGGVTWNQLFVPKPRDGEGEYYVLGFDRVRPGVSYLHVMPSDWGTGRSLYLSTDYCETFQEIWRKPDRSFDSEPLSTVGLDGPGTFRKWWKAKSGAAQGVYILSEEMEIIDSIDFLKAAFGARLDELRAEYANFGISAKSFYEPLADPLLYRLIAAGSVGNGKDTITSLLQYRLESRDGGHNWRVLDSSINTPFVQGWWTLPGSDRSYLLTRDTFEVKQPSRSKLYSLWSMMPHSDIAPSAAESPVKLWVTPNPGKGEYTLRVTGWKSHELILEVIDLNGRKLFESALLPHHADFEIPLSLSLVSGVYRVVARSNESHASASIIVTR